MEKRNARRSFLVVDICILYSTMRGTVSKAKSNAMCKLLNAMPMVLLLLHFWGWGSFPTLMRERPTWGLQAVEVMETARMM